MRPFDLLRKGDEAVKNALVTEDTDDADVIKLMAANANTIQRPIVEVGDKAVLARPIDKALELIKH